MFADTLLVSLRQPAPCRRALFGLLALFTLGCNTAWAGPHIQHWQAPSGAQVYFVEDHSLPMLDVSVNFPAGSGYDTPATSGLAALTQGMLDHGATGLSEDDISRKLADIGATLGGNFDQDRAGISLRTLSSASERNQALEVLSRLLQHPTFPQKILTREIARTIASLKEAETQPEAIASRAFALAVYGNHPYGLRPEGEIATVRKLKRADLQAFYRQHYSARTAVVALMGDISRQQAEQIAQQLTEKLPTGGATAAIPPVDMQIKGGETRISHPASQSHILIGEPGISRTDPDYFTLYVGNYILGGGGFVSRLMNEVREKHGMAYSVYSYFMPLRQPGLFQIGLQTKKEQTEQALAMVRQTLDRFIKDGPSEKELQAAKDNIIGGFALRVDNNRKILEYLSVIGFYGLPLTYLDDFPGKVQKVTVEQVRDAFKRRVLPERLATVIVGAPAAGKRSTQ